MKYRKLMAKCFAYKSNNTAHVAVAVVAGLAAGAILSILFAPDSGSGIRANIANRAKDVGNGIDNAYGLLRNRLRGAREEEVSEIKPVPQYVQKTTKKRKSDIKDIIHDAHAEEHHNDQAIS